MGMLRKNLPLLPLLPMNASYPATDLDLTVVIPTYNGAKRLPAVLDKLKGQQHTEAIRWEILVVDNNSQDDTATLIQQSQADWPAAIPLRYAFEGRQGAAFARQHAIRAAKGRLIGFLDDDNWPAPDWVANILAFHRSHPQAGAFGGQIHGDYEVPPPEGFEKIRAYMAIREQGPQPFRFRAENLQLPPAASLVVQRQAWLQSVPPHPTLTGKLPGLFIQGDDYEPLLYLHKAGWEIWYAPDLHTDHQIPRQRLERDYLMTLARGCGLATYHLGLINTPPGRQPQLMMRTVLGNLRRIILQFVRHSRHLKTDLVAAFQMEFYIGSFLSPFIRIQKGQRPASRAEKG